MKELIYYNRLHNSKRKCRLGKVFQAQRSSIKLTLEQDIQLPALGRTAMKYTLQSCAYVDYVVMANSGQKAIEELKRDR